MGAVLALLAESSSRRREATHVLDQAVEAEFAMGRLWVIRMGLSPANGGEP